MTLHYFASALSGAAKCQRVEAAYSGHVILVFSSSDGEA